MNEESSLKSQYSSAAQSLVDWIHSTIATLQVRDFDNTLQGAIARSDEFTRYKTGPKAEHSARVLPEVRRLYASIDTLLKKNKRPDFVPSAGLSLADIDQFWQQLEEEERRKDEDVRKELDRQEKLATLVRYLLQSI